METQKLTDPAPDPEHRHSLPVSYGYGMCKF